MSESIQARALGAHRPRKSVALCLALIALLGLYPASLFAQTSPGKESTREVAREKELDPAEERALLVDERLAHLEAELARVKEVNDQQNQLNIRARRGLRVYGDISMRYHGVFPKGSRRNDLEGGNELSRPEYRLRLGLTGYLFDSDKHRFKFDLRLSTIGEGEYNDAPLGAPTQGWTPANAFGSTGGLGFDRFNFHHTYKQTFRFGAGRFGSIFAGSQLIYDNDIGFDGAFMMLDLGSGLKLYERKSFDAPSADIESEGLVHRLQLRAAIYYLAQNNTDLPEPVAGTLPHGFGAQIYAKVALPGLDNSLTLVPGFHFFEGEEAIAANIGTGTTATTTNQTNSDGRVHSEFYLVELYSELILLEQQIASLKIFGHGTYNLGLDVPDGSPVSRKEPFGFVLGVQYGALRLAQQRDFRITYTWAYIPADTAIPEFNGDDLNTNFVGHEVNVSYTIINNVTAFASYQIGWRENEALPGVGRLSDGRVGSPSNDREERWRIGLIIRF